MPIAKSYPVRFTPRGLVDAFDATDTFPGACTALTNLIFDHSNPEIMISRPGCPQITAFPGFSNPGFISVHITVGSVTYGMISTSRNANKDEPFAYDNATGNFISIAGVTGANSPTSLSTGGDWTPPTMANVGALIYVTHPGFPGGASKFGLIDITTPSAPVWSASDTGTNALTGTPAAVSNFNNRAYFVVGNILEYTDVLANNRTNSTQALTIGDSAPVLALSGLPIQTTSSGVVQALIAFKAFQTWQITGDPATNNLAQNYLSLTIGTQAPRSVQQSPLGTYFASFFGPQIIDQLGILRPHANKLGGLEPDILQPYQSAATPSRIAAGYSGTIYRICMQTTLLGQTSTNDYWFDEHRRRWSGPHTFPYDCVSAYSNYFILSSASNPGALFKSEMEPSSSTVYTDNGTAFMGTMQSATFPKTGHMAMKQMVESTQELASSGGASSYAITALDDQGNTLNSCQITVQAAGTLWGSGVWGGFKWASAINRPATYTVPWTAPLVFKKMALYLTATATTALSIGTFMGRWQDAGYTNNIPPP